MRRFEIGKPLAVALAICLALSPTLFVVSLREGRNVDPESVLVMFAGAIAIVDRRPACSAAIVLLGCFVREAALFLIPFAYAVWAERLWDPPRAARHRPGVAAGGRRLRRAAAAGADGRARAACSATSR